MTVTLSYPAAFVGDLAEDLASDRRPLARLAPYKRSARALRKQRKALVHFPTHFSSTAAAETAGAVQLFMARARDAEPQFSPDKRVAAIAVICRRLDGIPLAIELAAARTSALGVEDLAARLDNRFKLLTGERHTALPLHETLRATLDWSYELLPATERAVLRRLSVFAGSFTMEAASAVAAGGGIADADVLDYVANLVAKSLIAADAARAVLHYRFQEPTRAYALEKLNESGEFQEFARRIWECSVRSGQLEQSQRPRG